MVLCMDFMPHVHSRRDMAKARVVLVFFVYLGRDLNVHPLSVRFSFQNLKHVRGKN